jgi:hypothetical protein
VKVVARKPREKSNSGIYHITYYVESTGKAYLRMMKIGRN